MPVPVPADPFPDLTAPSGPDAALATAHRHAAVGRHVHLVSDTQTLCLSGHCPTTHHPEA